MPDPLTMPSPISVMLVEDHPEYRESLALALGKVADIDLASQFGTAEQALHFLQEATPEQTPHLILLDLKLPAMSGIEAISKFKERLPNTPIIILTQYDREADVLAAISAGAAGYLLKSASRDQIAEAIRTVIGGGAPLDPKVAQFILTTLRKRPQTAEPTTTLSEREMEVLRLMGEGLLQKEIAERLDISNHTVGNHIRHIYEKLHVPNAPAAIAKAFYTGILPP